MHWELVILFFAVALVYSSVGFGGGSSYLALLTIFGIQFESLRLIALLCNIAVVSGSTWLYYKNNLLVWPKLWPLVLLSIPAAFVGGSMKLSEAVFFIILGITLCLAALAMWFTSHSGTQEKITSSSSSAQNALMGGGIGFLSGLVGIGGGIFLSPLLYLTHWDRAKVISATASFFILVNSISGIIGQWINNPPKDLNSTFVLSLLASVIVGGQIGVRTSLIKFNPLILRRLTAVLILYVGVRIIWKYIF